VWGYALVLKKKGDDHPLLIEDPCPSTLKVGKQKLESKMFVACHVTVGGGGGGKISLQLFL
jgi:hypothetical protein